MSPDIVIITVPGLMQRIPQAAPALLKGTVEAAGFTCRTLDFNLQFYQEVSDYQQMESYFMTGLNPEEESNASELIKKWTLDIIKLNPKFVGISVFTYQNRVATELFCRHIKQLSNIKIILGGQGLSDGGILGAAGFGKTLFDQQLADYWIRSEGEVSLVELLKGNTNYPGINSDTFKQIDDLDSVPFPNYDDYDLDAYEMRSLPITGSRGCVRSCSFCDIHDHWKYRFRTGQNMADEMLYLNKKYNITHFNFTDSLNNGSLREFRKFIKIIADHNRNSETPLQWMSQFIVRPPGQVNEEYWKNIADSGAVGLGIGVETGSDRVREHMNKKFSNADLDYTMTMLDKYKISCVFLMIVGYPTETEEDFQETMDMFVRYKKYNHIIKNVVVGSTLSILPGTPLFNEAEESNIILDKYENNWVALNNPELTLEKRIQRRHTLKDHVLKLGFAAFNDSEHMMEILDDKLEMFNKRTEIKKMIRLKNVTKTP
jgi:radical SAM superfamily enzyme YgiQ (UPF0313 family)